MVSVAGIIFRRSIRSSYVSLDLDVSSSSVSVDRIGEEEAQSETHVVVIIQFDQLQKEGDVCSADANADVIKSSSPTQYRSYVRRSFKLGDEVEVIGGKWINTEGKFFRRKLELIGFRLPNDSTDTDTNSTGIRIVRRQAWNNIRCQKARAIFYPPIETDVTKNNGEKKNRTATSTNTSSRKRRKDYGDGTDGAIHLDADTAGASSNGEESKVLRHGGGIGKRKQGDIVAEFLISRISDICNGSAIDYLNNDGSSGVVDAAGGSGHVSLALSLKGVKSTVVDPRPTVGRLPKRDRKALRVAIKRHQEGTGKGKDGSTTNVGDVKPPPVQFSVLRAWFGSKPEGVDVTFREGVREQSGTQEDTSVLPICHMCSPDQLLPSCKTIVALHPDEATGDIVDFAVKNQIPFCVIPCCVFSRLFTNRFKPQKEGSSGLRELVSTYDDLIEWLCAKDPSIKVETLPFDGANKAVWSMFGAGNRYKANELLQG